MAGQQQAACTSSFGEYIRSAAPTLQKPFRGVRWLPTGFLQTAASGSVHKLPKELLPFNRQMISVPSGGEMSIDWFGEPKPNPSAVVVVLPGAGRSVPEDGSLIQQLASLVHHECTDYQVGMWICQGLGGIPLSSHKFPGAPYASTDDLTVLFRTVRERYPSVPLVVIGASMGTAIFTNWAARNNEEVERLRLGPALLLAFGHSVRRAARTVPLSPVPCPCP